MWLRARGALENHGVNVIEEPSDRARMADALDLLMTAPLEPGGPPWEAPAVLRQEIQEYRVRFGQADQPRDRVIVTGDGSPERPLQAVRIVSQSAEHLEACEWDRNPGARWEVTLVLLPDGSIDQHATGSGLPDYTLQELRALLLVDTDGLRGVAVPCDHRAMVNEVKITPADEGEARELLRKHDLPEGSTFVTASSDKAGGPWALATQDGQWAVFVAVRPDGTLLEESTGDVPAGVLEQMRAVARQAHDVPDEELRAKADALVDPESGIPY